MEEIPMLPFQSLKFGSEKHISLMAAPAIQQSAVEKPSEESLWVFSPNINSVALNDWSPAPPWAIKTA